VISIAVMTTVCFRKHTFLFFLSPWLIVMGNIRICIAHPKPVAPALTALLEASSASLKDRSGPVYIWLPDPLRIKNNMASGYVTALAAKAQDPKIGYLEGLSRAGLYRIIGHYFASDSLLEACRKYSAAQSEIDQRSIECDAMYAGNQFREGHIKKWASLTRRMEEDDLAAIRALPGLAAAELPGEIVAHVKIEPSVLRDPSVSNLQPETRVALHGVVSRESSPIVDVVLNGQHRSMMLDTGAYLTSVPMKDAALPGYFT
jgi:hypothetical protein